MSSLPPFQTYSPAFPDAGVEPDPSPALPDAEVEPGPSLGLPDAGVEPGPSLGLQDAGVEPGPSQQGRLSSCVAHALAKAVCAAGWKNNPRINFLQEDAINQCIQLGGERAVTEGSLPDYDIWRGSHILLKEDGVSAGAPGGFTYKATFTKIEKCSSGDYDGEKQHVLVCWYGVDQNLRHCVYVTGKRGTSYDFWNSHGDQNGEEEIEVTKPGNQLYQVDVNIQELSTANVSSFTPGANTIALTKEEKDDSEEEMEDPIDIMSEIIVAGVKKICSIQTGFDEMFASDIGVRENYKLWKNDHAGIMMDEKIKQILRLWAIENAPDPTPEKMYRKIVRIITKKKAKKCYIQIKEDLKKKFNFAE